MPYDFGRPVDRRASNSEKWHFDLLPRPLQAGRPEPLPMWLADMDFPTAPAIVDALGQALSTGMLGYSFVTEHYREAVVQWQLKRYGWQVQAEWLLQTPGVVAALSQVIKAFSAPGDAILIQTPVYARFGKLCRLLDRRVVNAPLLEQQASYAFDPAEFESVIRQERPKLFVLCNPHNPVGKVWGRDELQAMGDICLRHGVLVVSDEIHADLLINPDCRHLAFAQIDPAFAQNSIICTSPSKTFNLSGLQLANIVVPNVQIRQRLRLEMEGNGVAEVNALGLVACEAAYRAGEPWLEALLAYLRGNHQLFADSVARSLPSLKVFKPDALYLAWLDCRGLGLTDAALEEFMLNEAGVWFISGASFGQGGEGFMRVNLACPRQTLHEALDRMSAALAQARPGGQP
ncbi:MalY/PatB family protein [Roseateles sp. DB2]|uniref:MalY/PatB family protein n=1 Tax=Roseateles sp. DB2 TaxID=3453717 RepID=UPI003EF05B3C